MAVKIRFARIGKKHAPIYKIVAIDSRRKRDGMYLENLGTYNPKTKDLIQFHDDRIAHWISLGAEPTDAVTRLIKLRKHKNISAVSSVAAPIAQVKKTVKKVAVKKESESKTTEPEKTKAE
ncbi:30S ribosomal protein S16 [candidate division TM6 bacterium RIFCSPHIGHO2_12_FULL_38_8]|nr:MAG: 30S ribosomal protein S16 [candidate division TM6 bacterium RIFCSPHIGHO2_12_FULL_38_8]